MPTFKDLQTLLSLQYEQQHKTIISAGWQLREARRNQFENLQQFYLTERCYKNIIERPSYMCKIRQINRPVKLYFVTYILERLSIMLVVPRWWVFKAQRSSY